MQGLVALLQGFYKSYTLRLTIDPFTQQILIFVKVAPDIMLWL
jgi:hypothetical protein